MSWVSPRTWVTDEIVTAAQLNEQLRDNTLHLRNRLQNRGYYTTTGSFATTSTSYVDVTSATLTITPTVNRIQLLVTASVNHASSSQSVLVAYAQDGGADVLLDQTDSTDSMIWSAAYLRVLTVTIGVATTIKLRLRVSTGTGAIARINMLIGDLYNV